MTLWELINELESLGVHPETEVMMYDYAFGETDEVDHVGMLDEQVVIF